MQMKNEASVTHESILYKYLSNELVLHSLLLTNYICVCALVNGNIITLRWTVKFDRDIRWYEIDL